MHSLFKASFFLFFLLFVAGFLWHQTPPSLSLAPAHHSSLFMTAQAEEDDEDENEREDDESEGKSSTQQTIKVWKEVIEYRPVVEKVTVTEEGYERDTDNDSLVDALDPDPLVSQKAYFTDQDNDFVPDALDRHPNEDDFSYYESETDDNHNGILDSYER